MTVVADANLLVALLVPMDYSPQARERFRVWLRDGTEVSAPVLWIYEAVSTLRKLTALGYLTSPEAQQAVDEFGRLGIQTVEPTTELRRRSLHWAERLNQHSAYDAAYLAVAEALEADLWTADGRLARNARSLKVHWVHSIVKEE